MAATDLSDDRFIGAQLEPRDVVIRVLIVLYSSGYLIDRLYPPKAVTCPVSSDHG